jgi:hypothetical protein
MIPDGRCGTIVPMLDWRRFEGLTSLELTNALQVEVDRMMRGLADDEEDALLVRLPQPLRVLWLLDWLDFEVAQGSLLAYFSNSHGRHAMDAAQALRDVGATHMADTLTRAAELAAAARGEWEARWRQLSQLDPGDVLASPYAGLPHAEALDELTDEYRVAAEQDEWGEKLESFLARSVRVEVERSRTIALDD